MQAMSSTSCLAMVGLVVGAIALPVIVGVVLAFLSQWWVALLSSVLTVGAEAIAFRVFIMLARNK